VTGPAGHRRLAELASPFPLTPCSGRRGRRFKSGHPDRKTAGHKTSSGLPFVLRALGCPILGARWERTQPTASGAVSLQTIARNGAIGEGLGWGYSPPPVDVSLGGGLSLGEGVTLGGGLSLGEGVTLGGGLSLGEGVTLGGGLSLGQGVTLGGGLSLGEGVTLGVVQSPVLTVVVVVVIVLVSVVVDDSTVIVVVVVDPLVLSVVVVVVEVGGFDLVLILGVETAVVVVVPGAPRLAAFGPVTL
jgi:hypothetical protein